MLLIYAVCLNQCVKMFVVLSRAYQIVKNCRSIIFILTCPFYMAQLVALTCKMVLIYLVCMVQCAAMFVGGNLKTYQIVDKTRPVKSHLNILFGQFNV